MSQNCFIFTQYAIKLISFLLDVVLTMLTKKVIFERQNILSFFKYLITGTVKHHIYASIIFHEINSAFNLHPIVRANVMRIHFKSGTY